MSLSPDEREIINLIAARHGAQAVRLFGSEARGQAGPVSDVDLLVTMAPGSSLFDIIAIKQEVEDAIAREVDVVTEGALSPYFRDRVLQEAIPL